MDVVGQGLTIADAARAMGVSAKTVRRLIKAGRVKAELVQGQFGQEYRIRDLPAGLGRGKGVDRGATESTVQTSVQGGGQDTARLLEMVKDLQEKNLALAAQLGMAHERIRNLEGEVKALGAGKARPWWKRLFGRR